MMQSFGPTGRHPAGKIAADDEGEINIGIAFDQTAGLVRIEFGTPVTWLALSPEKAIELAKLLMKHAGAGARN